MTNGGGTHGPAKAKKKPKPKKAKAAVSAKAKKWMPTTEADKKKPG
jgi:hypothetical protein